MPPSHRRGCRPEKLAFARRMRRTPTLAESMLWQRLRCRQIDDLRFRHQAIFFGFIADFYCPKIKLVVEVDGSAHVGREEYDALRDKRITDAGFRVLRVTNEQVYYEIEGVLQRIRDAIPK